MKKLLPLILLLIFSCDKDAVAPDTTAPTVVITYPANNSTLDSTATVTVDVADDGEIGIVKLLVDGVETYADTTAPYQFVWDVCVQATGTHTLMAKTEDGAGNQGQSDLLTFTINANYDCADVCGGDKLLDNCEVCDADTSNDCAMDECGEWGGDNSTCTDNCGVINGNNAPNTGTCDCFATPNGTAYTDDCNDCIGGNTELEPNYAKDNCGVCDGNNSPNTGTCDCEGTPNGTAWVSDCGCVSADNDGNDCDDCLNVPNGTAWVSDCGCVDADNDGNDCDDCEGTPNGDAVADCAGTCNGNATTDNCGTCDDDDANNCVQDCQGVWGGNAYQENGSCVIFDIDGNVYETIQIGDQLWMAENLKVTHYSNGDEIPTGLSCEWPGYDWANTTEGAYAVYDDDPANADVYGYLYNWAVVDDSRGICPEGFHVPTSDEFTVLEDELSGISVAGGKMKSTGNIDSADGLWYYPNEGATNESGFTALPGGVRLSHNGYYSDLGQHAHFWASNAPSGLYNQPIAERLSYDRADIEYPDFTADEHFGYSIRCLKD